ncbi:MAG: VOC family protein [Chloroflexi bacterium]|nr:VOC family protein [Chloroflexota bacterium]
MNLGELHHIGIAVPSLERALPFYQGTLGLAAGPAVTLADQAVRVRFLTGPGTRVELLEPTDDLSGVAKFVASRGGKASLHHACFVVDDLAATLDRLARDGVELIDRAPRKGAEGDVAFLHPRAGDGVLVELIDRASLHTGHS